MRSPVIRQRADHPISRSAIDPDVLKVLYRLHGAGFKGYLVGGSVRDLLLGRKPNDFDIGTDAHPNEVRKLFRNSRIIGRRFRLAHILFGARKAIEVSTFRRRPNPPQGGEERDLLLTEDNTFGTPVEDALRRDFTINGLFYDIATFSIIDHVGGLADLEDRVLRVIGDPDIRFREDPVRMLRAIEFAARLDFTLTLDTYDAIVRHRKEVRRSAAPRVTEEILGMLRGPRPLATFRLFREVGLLEVLLPELVQAIAAHTDPDRGEDGTLFWKYLAILEDRSARGLPQTSDPILIGLLFLSVAFHAISSRLRAGRTIANPDFLRLLDEMVDPIALRLSLANATTHLLKQSIFSLGRFDQPVGSDAAIKRFVERTYFPSAFALYEIHAVATGRHADSVERWRRHLAELGEIHRERRPPPGDRRPARPHPGPRAPREVRPDLRFEDHPEPRRLAH